MATQKPRPPDTHRWAWMPRTKQIRVARAELKITVGRIAQDLGRNPTQISDILLGYRRPTEELAREIAEYLGKDLESLFFRIDLENPDQASAA
jgi:transcriptional regulator with XRE-family HTH domain